jgi:hypothetical protein
MSCLWDDSEMKTIHLENDPIGKLRKPIVDEQMLQTARNLVSIRLEFELRAKEYHNETVKLRKDAERQLKKLEKEFYK